MSASALMSMATQAVFAAYRQVQTTSNNIANANVEGYSRQEAQLETAHSEFTGSGWVGRGVNVTTITRASNQFLTDQANALTSAAGTDAVRSTLLDQLQQVFGKTSSGMGYAATQVFNAYADLAAAPSDLSARQAVLGRLDDFASLARANGQNIEALQTQVHYDIRNTVSEVNGAAKAIARLNGQIVGAMASGHAPNDLLDQRDQLVKQLAEQVEVHTVTGGDGNMAVFLASGQTLVLGMNSNQLVAPYDANDPSHLTLGVQIDGSLTLLSRNVAGEGRLAGLFQFQNHDLTEARNRLGQMVSALAGELNAQQAAGLDLNGQTGGALFNIPAPRAVAALTNPVDASGAFLSSMGLSITDPSALMASDYQLDIDSANPGQYTLTRLSDGLVRSGLADGSVVDGFRIEAGVPAPTGGERYLLQPVANAPGQVEVAMRNPLGLAAANPVTVSAGVDNLGTMGIGTVAIRSAPAGAYAQLTVRFTSDTGDYDVLDSGGTLLASGSFVAGSPLAYDGIEVSLSGLPRAGDTLSVSPTVHVANSNGNALTLQSLGNQLLVGGQTAADAFASLLSEMGVRTQSAKASAGSTSSALQRANTQLSGETGVNLDEEAARLIQYQQSYQAAAKVLQTAQALLDTVINLAR